MVGIEEISGLFKSGDEHPVKGKGGEGDERRQDAKMHSP
jgi:hypothetical protein